MRPEIRAPAMLPAPKNPMRAARRVMTGSAFPRCVARRWTSCRDIPCAQGRTYLRGCFASDHSRITCETARCRISAARDPNGPRADSERTFDVGRPSVAHVNEIRRRHAEPRGRPLEDPIIGLFESEPTGVRADGEVARPLELREKLGEPSLRVRYDSEGGSGLP